MRIVNKYYLFGLFVFTISCESNIDTILNSDLLFKSAYEIRIPEYSFNDGSYNIMGDKGYAIGYTDTMPAAPILEWESINSKIICAGIFKNEIIIKDNAISNSYDMVWFWYNNLEQGIDGHVEFNQGKKITNGDVNNLEPPQQLITDSIYYWCVWGWDESATYVTYSSRQLKFIVK